MLDSAPLTFRPTCPEDDEFLFQLYSSTRTEELEAWGWDTQQPESFLRMQFEAQRRSYQTRFPGGEQQLILFEECPVGQIFVVRKEEEIRLVDITLLPEHRNRGIGTSLIQNLLVEASQERKPVRLFVVKFNPAVRLYERLGFKKTDDTGIHFLMEWSQESSKNTSRFRSAI